MNSLYLNDFYSYISSQKRYSKNTLCAYKRDLTLFFNFIKNENITIIDHVIIQSYLSSLYQQNQSATTIARKLSSIKSYGKYLSMFKNINCDYLTKIAIPKKAKNLPEYIHEDELSKILNLPLNNFLDIRNALILNMLYSTGMRLSELSNLKTNDYNKNENIFRIIGKGNKERIVIFSSYTKYLLELYLKERKDISSPYLFINKNNTKLSNRGIQLIITNISKKYLGHDKLHPHMLRHTYATKLLNNGIDLRTLQELLGHSNLNATQIYTHIAKSELSELYSNYHPLGDNLEQ